MQDKRVDNRWGEYGSPLLPGSLRDAWADEPLPQWIAAELKLWLNFGGARPFRLDIGGRQSANEPAAKFSSESRPSAALGDSSDQGIRAAGALLA